jgi:hypothetical protein
MNLLDSSGQIISTYTMGIISNHQFYNIDGDSDLDLFVYGSGVIYEYISDGRRDFSGCSIVSDLSSGWVVIGDFNNDNKIDYVYFTAGCNSTNYFAVQD